MRIELEGIEDIVAVMERLRELDLTPVFSKQIGDMWNRSNGTNAASGGTPYDTGDLKKSRFKKVNAKEGVFGYNIDYAPHVEFGHRTRNGGYVPGQYFLRSNLEAQKKIYKSDVEKVVSKLL